jgi:hypothetical protein
MKAAQRRNQNKNNSMTTSVVRNYVDLKPNISLTKHQIKNQISPKLLVSSSLDTHDFRNPFLIEKYGN